jgi:hypothetical protein
MLKISTGGVTQRLTTYDINMTLVVLAQVPTVDVTRCSEVEMTPPGRLAAVTAEADVRASA